MEKKKLPPNAGKGKKPGTQNRSTKVLKEAILLAAEAVGEDGKGKKGLQGYLERVARKDVKAFSTLLGKVLPLQVTGMDDGPIEQKIVGPVEIAVSPSDAYMRMIGK